MLHLAPTRVTMGCAVQGRMEPLSELLPELIAHGVRQVSPNGVPGDPTGADVARGEMLLRRLVDDIVLAVRSGRAERDGRPPGYCDPGDGWQPCWRNPR